jgi:ribonuclease D
MSAWSIIKLMSLPAITAPSAPPVWVSRPEIFKRMVDDLSHRWVFAIDTESNSLYAYREQVCLIQISTGETDYLVDPLSLSDLSALGPIFADPRIEKVFHAAEYDVICLKRDFGFTFANLFDTMVASRDLGRRSVGLAAILLEEFGVDVDKRYQRANWGARPLSPAMLAYARLDSYYLIPLRHRLKTALEEMERWPLAEEDFNRLCDTFAPPLESGTCQWWRVAAGQDINAREAAVLFEVCQYRDQRARQADLPAFKVLSNQMLVQIAKACPQNDADLMRASGLRGRQLERHSQGLLEAVKRGMEAPPLHKPVQPRPDDHYLNRLERLKIWRRRTGQDWGVESDVILPRDVMEALALAAPRELAGLDEVMASVPWRKRQFGKKILSAMHY